jgi:hypothetical protein
VAALRAVLRFNTEFAFEFVEFWGAAEYTGEPDVLDDGPIYGTLKEAEFGVVGELRSELGKSLAEIDLVDEGLVDVTLDDPGRGPRKAVRIDKLPEEVLVNGLNRSLRDLFFELI